MPGNFIGFGITIYANGSGGGLGVLTLLWDDGDPLLWDDGENMEWDS